MGIFDGVMGGQGGLTNKEYETFMEQRRIENAVLAHQAQQAQNYNHLYGQLGQAAQAGAVQGLGYAAAQQMEAEFNPNDHEAWTMSMSALVNLWRAKFMDAWIIYTWSEHDKFWQQAYTRLNDMSKFERAPGNWVRLREDA
jgi:hypothetical protein